MRAGQGGEQGYRYHTMMVGRKEELGRANTCCEGQATRLIGMLPEFIYSLAEDGVYVNLFEPSSIVWAHSDQTLRLEMDTSCPKNPQVRLQLHAARAVHAKLRIRTPSWATGVMEVAVNGKRVALGNPGTYVTLDWEWTHGDEVTFVLPIGLKLTKYTGADQIAGRERYGLEYGPLLMAALSVAESELSLRYAHSPTELVDRLQPAAHCTSPRQWLAPSGFPTWQWTVKSSAASPSSVRERRTRIALGRRLPSSFDSQSRGPLAIHA